MHLSGVVKSVANISASLLTYDGGGKFDDRLLRLDGCYARSRRPKSRAKTLLKDSDFPRDLEHTDQGEKGGEGGRGKQYSMTETKTPTALLHRLSPSKLNYLLPTFNQSLIFSF